MVWVVAQFAVAALGACPDRERRTWVLNGFRRSLSGQAPSAATAAKMHRYRIIRKLDLEDHHFFRLVPTGNGPTVTGSVP